ncbi:hypothetical protein PG985_016322 [Apiospora marii]|uniref:uncharacterized protein n=1 Tax=Apiospora marii TaxID=335849 RepID=UPI003132124A
MSDQVPQWLQLRMDGGDPTEESHPALDNLYPGFIPALKDDLNYGLDFGPNYDPNLDSSHDPNHRYSRSHNGIDAALHPQRVVSVQRTRDNGSDAWAATGSTVLSTGPTLFEGTTTDSSWRIIDKTQKGNGKNKESRHGEDESHCNKISVSSARQSGPRFACPYFVRGTLGEQCTDVCQHGFKRPSDVKQHIYRRHRKLPHCPICGRIFVDQDLEREAHIKSKTCSRVEVDVPGLSEDKWEELCKARAPPHTVGGGDPERWFMIWDIIFPLVKRPSSPYTSSGKSFRETALAFLTQNQGGWNLIMDRFPSNTPNIHPDYREELHQLLMEFTQNMIEYGEQQERGEGSG